MKLASLIAFTFVSATSIAQESIAFSSIPDIVPDNNLSISEINYSNQSKKVLGKTVNSSSTPIEIFNKGACNTNAKISGLKSSSSRTSVSISFNNLSNINTYEIRTFNRGSFNGSLNGSIKYTSGKSSPINVTGLQPGRNYTFAIRAICNSGSGVTALASINASTADGENNNGGSNIGTPQNYDTECQNRNTVDQGVTIWPNANSWKDSYNANGFCFCNSTFDHGTGNFNININGRPRNIKDICNELTKHPKYRKLNNGDKRYNSLQCGHAPRHNDAISIQGRKIKDEQVCPGRVDQGSKGCKCKGPKFDMKWLASRPRFKASARRSNTNSLSTTSNGSFNTFPLPALIGKSTFLKVEAKESTLATISIYNLNGNLISSINSNVTEGASQINIKELITAAGTPGVYALVYKAGNVKKSKTIIIK